MKNGLSNLAAAVSAGLMLAAAGLWAFSYATETILVESGGGQIVLVGVDAPPGDVREFRGQRTLGEFLHGLSTPVPFNDPRQRGWVRDRRALGFRWTHGNRAHLYAVGESRSYRHMHRPFWIVAVPYWFVTLLAAVLPARWAWRARRGALRRRAHACPDCGYDLRATPGRCPECGAEFRVESSEFRKDATTGPEL